MKDFTFWGAATVGTKGQIVIPADARDKLGLQEGDKLLIVTPPHSEAVVVVKPAALEAHLKKMHSEMRDILDATNEGDQE